MEGSGHVRRGKAETSRRLFSASPAPPLSRDPAGQCFAPGYNLSAPGEDTVHLQSSVCANVKKKKKKRMSADFFMMMCNRLTYCCTEL